MKKTLWTDTAALPSFPRLERDEKTEVLIIGGGMAGILCAHFLRAAGIDYLLCEANTIASGTTAGTTAVISAQHGAVYSELIKKFGTDKASLYLEANLEALQEFRVICSTVDCDFEEAPSYVYSRFDASRMQKEAGAVVLLGFPAELVDEIPLPIKIAAAVKFPGQAEFHPLKFIAGICPGMNIRQGAQVRKIDGSSAYTDEHKISAKKIIVASHFPIMNTHGLFFAKLYQKRSYVIAIEGAPQYDGTFAEDTPDGLYFRNYKDLLIVGGGDHRTGKPGKCWDVIRRFVKENYPGARERYVWATQDCMSLDSVPYIGRYSRALKDVFVASGFNEWGMTSSMVAAKILTDMVMGRENKYAGVFDPSRSMLSGQLFANLGVTLADFVIPTVRRCPHLGCALKWNALEHTWDCPCHGSRFEADGKLIDNPATRDFENSKQG
ncbi:MAG TPA: FAD-dependent oxidoreductase [Clostridiales bacterium]|jgi:glycine/D-amino acid oxidase-like deaminating enzyme|nr:FAD-dependent oxidoreductase [Clostridiales bacterium]